MNQFIDTQHIPEVQSLFMSKVREKVIQIKTAQYSWGYICDSIDIANLQGVRFFFQNDPFLNELASYDIIVSNREANRV